MKQLTTKKSAKSGEEVPVNSGTNNNPHQPAAGNAPAACMSLQIADDCILMPDDAEPTTESHNQPLTSQEEQDLERCEAIIENGKRAFVETCAALSEVCSRKLYRKKYKSFREYCQEKWGFTREYGHRLVRDHNTIQKVRTIVHTPNLITNGSQAAAIAMVPGEKIAAVMEIAKKKAGEGKITGRHIKEAARVLLPQETERPDTNLAVGEVEEPEKTLSLTEQWADMGYPSFGQMVNLIREIHENWEDLEQHTHVANRIVQLKIWLDKYAAIERAGRAA